MKTKFLLLLIAASALLASCQSQVDMYTRWLYKYMPLPDKLQYPDSYWRKNVEKTLQVREQMAWDIPEREFRHFVLPLRVNNETTDNFRLRYSDTLCARVQGMSLADAALEINHWCHEQAAYQPSDARTGGPESIIKRGVGRCGEESVLAVAAFRAAGIPARQVYTPRWAHTDDNHAWVEVWTGDGWHFMGACEPEPVLDRAWFNSAVSRAMILHTKVYGDYEGPEDVIRKTPCYTEINVIRNYVPARRTVVTVLQDGKPARGANVSFRIYNYAEFYNVVTYKADSKGQAALDTGLGDMFILAWNGERFGYGVARGEELTVELDHRFGEAFSDEIDIVPPAERPLISEVSEELVAQNRARLAEEDAIRIGHDHINHDVERFKANYPGRAEAVLAGLSEKDLSDVSYEVLIDAIMGKGPARIENEHLRPYRIEILSSEDLPKLITKEEVMAWCRKNIRIVEGRNPQELRTSPIAVWKNRKADELGLKIFYVALCRTLGIEAEMDLVTGAVESTAEKAYLKPLSDRYFREYTLSRFTPDGTLLLDYEQTGLPDILNVDEGYYLLTTGRRLANGSVLARLEFFTLEGGELRTLDPVVRDAGDMPSVIGSMDVDSLLPLTGRGCFMITIFGRNDEPASHARSELKAASGLLQEWGRPVVELPADTPLLESVPGPHNLPVIVLCDSFGRVFYTSSGYNTSLAADLERIIPKL